MNEKRVKKNSEISNEWDEFMVSTKWSNKNDFLNRGKEKKNR